MERRDYLLRHLRQYPTVKALRFSAFFAECREEIEAVLTTPEVCSRVGVKPRVASFLRVTQWNVEKGKNLASVMETCRRNEILKWADVVLLNEADHGMARSGNLHVAKVLAGALEANMVFAPGHFELTKGTDDDLAFSGQNRESLQGNAVLSRYPILDARVIRLPVCFEPFGFEEKRYGGRNCIWAKLQIGGRILWVGSIHLEVRNTPRCRKIQMQHVLENLPGTAADCYLLGGDFNSNSFSRGTLWRTCASIWKLIARPPSQLAQELRHPERGSEPLFQAAAKAGFSWQGLNSDEDTACAPINALEDARLVPECVIQSVKRRISALEGYLSFKLDWLMGKGLRSLRTGDVVDYATGISSLDPGCVRTERRGIHRISDHAPIHADIALPAGFMPQ